MGVKGWGYCMLLVPQASPLMPRYADSIPATGNKVRLLRDRDYAIVMMVMGQESIRELVPYVYARLL